MTLFKCVQMTLTLFFALSSFIHSWIESEFWQSCQAATCTTSFEDPYRMTARVKVWFVSRDTHRFESMQSPQHPDSARHETAAAMQSVLAAMYLMIFFIVLSFFLVVGKAASLSSLSFAQPSAELCTQAQPHRPHARRSTRLTGGIRPSSFLLLGC